ncbi:biotin--[acetyl-CoA-carboxylase] ligase [Desulfotruncus alcoholivorax]|uniref:biotin--[acetyl-CoA-carboxylase] ligase n=1 Tax=Desulfotruncus alcoholivorax TaxID=265477 RepID=UPI0004269ED2|nr:biotin--[acetyl-CoA-carboxylase] ligase [Desulfotruncus alcoholivorax]
MKQKILNILKRNQDWVSGETLCRGLGVSRTAVWKHISGLREDGYQIEAKANLGYRLIASPDVPFPAEVMSGLSATVFGHNLVHLEEVASTNAEAKKLAREGCPEGTVIIAETQNGGKGRLGRAWFSPRAGGLWFSIVLRPPVNLIDTPQVTMVAAVSVATAIREHTGVPAGIKWPNDILVDGKKICGILVELNAEMDRVDFMVAGIGLNVNIGKGEFPPELADIATSLSMESGRHIYRVPLLRSLLQQFETWYYRWLNEGFAVVLDKWRHMCVTLDCPVTVHTVKETYSGYAFDVDDTGALLVRTRDGSVQRLVAGEVTLRKQLRKQ